MESWIILWLGISIIKLVMGQRPERKDMVLPQQKKVNLLVQAKLNMMNIKNIKVLFMNDS